MKKRKGSANEVKTERGRETLEKPYPRKKSRKEGRMRKQRKGEEQRNAEEINKPGSYEFNTVKCKGNQSRKTVPFMIWKWKGMSFVNKEGRDRESFREKKNEQ